MLMPETMPATGLTGKEAATFRKAALEWYGKYARDLPWRAGRGQDADPYHVWLSEVMLQQTTVAAVIPYFVKFVDKWPAVSDLAAADDDAVMQAWAGLGYYARARNLLKCARQVSAEHGGRFPGRYDDLRALPGIGDYTAAAITAIAFGNNATVIDGNVERVVSRYFAITAPLPGAKPEIRARANDLFMAGEFPPDYHPGDFAQTLMDLGATICTPRLPSCSRCPVADGCAAHAAGIAADLPAKQPKADVPRRAGYIYWITDNAGRVMLEKRPDKGLLGGMVGLPTSAWVEWPEKSRKWPDISHISAMKDCQHVSMKKDMRIRHVFTHFRLELRGVFLRVPQSGFAMPAGAYWESQDRLAQIGFPTVFKKFVRLACIDAQDASG